MNDYALTATGTPCKLCLMQGRKGCPSHSPDVDLAARAATGQATLLARDPVDYSRKRRKAGKLGFKATMTRHGRSKAIEALIQKRLLRPTRPEQLMMAILDEMMMVYTREQYINADSHHTVDFKVSGNGVVFAQPIWIDVDGLPFTHQPDKRQQSFVYKIAALADEIYLTLTIDNIDKWPELISQAYEEAFDDKR